MLQAGCQTTLDPNYALQMESYRLTVTSQSNVEMAKARAEEARYQAMAAIADRADPQSKQLALVALALGGRGGSDTRLVPVQIPTIPESQEDRALKWAAIFAGPVTAVASGYFGYRLGVTQSNNQANSTIASYNAFSTTALGGYAANRDIAGGAFNVVNNANLRPLTPNITLNGNGVIGDGRYVGDNSGALSGNQGIIRIKSPDTTTRNCTGGTTDTAGSTNATC
jgi:hypothetical protein